VLRETADDAAVIVSSGRGVHEALAAAEQCARHGIPAGVVDMPSLDEALLLRLCDSGRIVCLAEQNNGYILQNLLRILFRHGRTAPANILPINTLGPDGRPQFIHSGTYEELTDVFGLTPPKIAAAIRARIGAMTA
jgi:transketolase C-terminal domain/subunit